MLVKAQVPITIPRGIPFVIVFSLIERHCSTIDARRNSGVPRAEALLTCSVWVANAQICVRRNGRAYGLRDAAMPRRRSARYRYEPGSTLQAAKLCRARPTGEGSCSCRWRGTGNPLSPPQKDPSRLELKLAGGVSISSDWTHLAWVTGGAAGDGFYASFFREASFLALTPR